MPKTKHNYGRESITKLILLVFATTFALILIQVQTRFSTTAQFNPPNTAGEYSQQYQLQAGTNHLSIPFSHLTAAQVCRQIPSLVSIHNLINQSWVEYPCDGLISNLTIKPNTGYLLTLNTPYTWTATGHYTKPIYTLSLGYNTIGFSPVDINRPTQAAQVCNLTSQNRKLIVESVSEWKNNQWSTHNCGYPINNFQTITGEAYLVKVTPTN